MQEIWKDVPNYEGLYQVSNLGRVKSFYGKNSKESKVIKNNSRNGYFSVILCNGTSKKNVFVHRLVAQCFVDNPKSKPVVNHIDGNKQNCRFDNLEWCTQQENVIHANENGLSKYKRKHVYQFDKSGTLIKQWDSVYQISESLNYKLKSLRNCIYGERKTAYGYIWSTTPYFEECLSKYKTRWNCKNKKSCSSIEFERKFNK